jgi:hypothetical protein
MENDKLYKQLFMLQAEEPTIKIKKSMEDEIINKVTTRY